QGTHVFETEAVGGQLGGIGLDADGRFFGPADIDLADAFDLAEALGNDLVGQLVNPGGRKQVGRYRQDENRRVRGVDFEIIGRPGQVDGEFAGGGVEGGLDIAGRAIDVTVEVELHGDVAAAERTGGSDFIDAGNFSEGAFERGGERGGDRFGIGARQAGGDGDHGEIDARQGSDGQETVGAQTEQQDSEGQQRCADRATDEWLGEGHGTRADPEPGAVRWARSDWTGARSA